MKQLSCVNFFVGLVILCSACAPISTEKSATPGQATSTFPTNDTFLPVSASQELETQEMNLDFPEVSLTNVAGEIAMLADDEAQKQLGELAIRFSQENSRIVIDYVAPPAYSAVDSPGEYFVRAAQSADVIEFIPGQQNLSDIFLDLQVYADRDEQFAADDFWPGALEGCRDSEGRLLGVPHRIISITGVFYDRKAFDEIGLSYPSPGWTWDQFRETVRLLNKQYSFADNGSSHQSILSPIVDQSLVAGQGSIQPEQLASQISWYFDLANQMTIYPLKDIQLSPEYQESWNELFNEYHPAMWVDALGSSLPGTGKLYSPDDPMAGVAIMEAGFAPFPISDELANTSPIQVSCLAISKQANDPVAAWKWIDFLSKQWSGTETSATLWQLPVRSSIAESSGFWNLLPSQVTQSVQFGLEHGWYGSRYPEAYENLQFKLSQVPGNGYDVLLTLQTSIP
jgi:ABC-type glycerol-3-phosphate transport system substrate-binding protein